MREAGAYLGQSYRWMQRHWAALVRAEVIAYRVPKGSEKGRLVFNRDSLARYVESCRVGVELNTTVEQVTQRSE